MDDEQRVIDDIVGGFDAHMASMLRDAMHRAYDMGFQAGWKEREQACTSRSTRY